MRKLLYRLHAFVHRGPHNLVISEVVFSVFLIVLLVSAPASAAMRFQERSLYMDSVEPGDTTSYTISFRYMSFASVGSVDMLFCVDPIPHHPCETPPGLDVSGATLSHQSGETGFSILTKSDNHIVLTRTPQMISASEPSSYRFDNIVNPTNVDRSFSVRLRSHSSQNATGPQIDFGSVKGQVTSGIVIQTQVPPILIFCVAEEVSEDCTSTNENYYKDMGNLSSDSTLVAQSQMAVGTNATGGFAITAVSAPMSAGLNVIDSLDEPTPSMQGINQFGINIVENDVPAVGKNPEGTLSNVVLTTDYSRPNMYKYPQGDLLAFSPNVSLMKRFTVSYVVNSHPDLKPGVYSTTVTYIASGRF